MNKQKKYFDRGSLLILFFDLVIFFVAPAFALWLCSDFIFTAIPATHTAALGWIYLIYAPVSLCIFFLFKTYHFVWRFISVDALYQIVPAAALSALAFVGASLLLRRPYTLSVYVITFIMLCILTVCLRFSVRLAHSVRHRASSPECTNIMIIGAGEAGRILIHEIQSSARTSDSRVVCVIDDNVRKRGKYIGGVPIVGGQESIIEAAERYRVNRIIFAIPSATPQMKRDILNICKETGCELKTVPGIYQFVNGDISVSMLREVSLEDLLGRDPIRVDSRAILDEHSGKTVLVTGGGGSIGSELCRQIASHTPKTLVIVDIYENNAYDLQQELLRQYPELDLQVRIASVRDETRMDQLFAAFRPDIVYHAAAHKHVPLMEDSPGEAVKNNVFGTEAVARCAARYGAQRFVLISTDKAVNPTSVMGASKRICEMLIQYWNRRSETDFVAVRFGNVLGSNGSVVPLFKKQIAQGGPVTVTHKDITRFFMTIPEAVSLVLQAGSYAKGGEIFVLDMGEPVRIDDLARNLIRLSGLTPDVDIPIVYTGLRPGEKLFEEVLLNEEGLQKTPNKLIYIAQPIRFDEERFESNLQTLRQLSVNDPAAVRGSIAGIVPTYSGGQS